jgi:hypothetical protein
MQSFLDPAFHKINILPTTAIYYLNSDACIYLSILSSSLSLESVSEKLYEYEPEELQQLLSVVEELVLLLLDEEDPKWLLDEESLSLAESSDESDEVQPVNIYQSFYCRVMKHCFRY